MPNFGFLADLIDDLNKQQLVELLNAIALSNPQIRATIKRWREDTGLEFPS